MSIILNAIEQKLKRIVWIDLENIYEDFLDVMTRVIEQSSCIQKVKIINMKRIVLKIKS